MIIVNQDKDEIVKFETIEGIGISPIESGQITKKTKKNYNIYAGNFTSGGQWVKLGTYITEKRAKEVLEAIVQFYIKTEEQNKVYRMPKE